MSKHTPEPWNDETHDRSYQTTGNIITRILRTMSDEDYDRACACVNACTGLANPAAELTQLREAVKLLGASLRTWKVLDEDAEETAWSVAWRINQEAIDDAYKAVLANPIAAAALTTPGAPS